jgi:hypothetical protein
MTKQILIELISAPQSYPASTFLLAGAISYLDGMGAKVIVEKNFASNY